MGNQRRRMILGSGSSSRLPAAFQEVEYLQSTGTQYIDTGVVANTPYTFKGSVDRITSVSNSLMFFGARNSNVSGSKYGMALGTNRNSSTRAVWWQVLTQRSVAWLEDNTKVLTANTFYDFECVYTSNNVSLSINGTQILSDSNTFLGCDYTILIFGWHQGSTAYYTDSQKQKAFQIIQNGTPIRNFIPCYRKADGVAGMYDTVGNQFYTNAGTGEFITGRPVDYLTMTVVIDETNSNPQTCCTYADDAIGMSSGSAAWDRFFGETPVLLDYSGNELGFLNPSNYAQYADGTSAPLTTSDVMVKFPKMGVKIERVGTTLRVSITNDPNAESRGFKYYAHSYGSHNNCDSIYVGAYKGYVASNKLYSSSGKTPIASRTIANFRTYAEARGTGYEQMTFYVRTFLTALYLIKYKNLDSQSAVGMGAVNTSLKTTGNTNAKGLNYGSTSSTEQVKCLGIEDMWGNIYEFMDGIVTDASYHILTAPTNSSLGTTSSYTDQGQGATRDLGSYTVTAQGTTETGFIIKTDGGSASTYYCDFTQLSASCFGEVGGAWGATEGGGIFSASIWRAASYSATSAGSRLVKFNVGGVVLYDNGDEKTSVTGGWGNTVHYGTRNGNPVTNSSGTKSSNYMTVSLVGVSGTYLCNSLSTANKISLAGYTKLCLDVDVTTKGEGKVCGTQATTYNTGSGASNQPIFQFDMASYATGRRIVEIDISSYSDDAYIEIDKVVGWSSDAHGAMNIYKVWLE